MTILNCILLTCIRYFFVGIFNQNGEPSASTQILPFYITLSVEWIESLGRIRTFLELQSRISFMYDNNVKHLQRNTSGSTESDHVTKQVEFFFLPIATFLNNTVTIQNLLWYKVQNTLCCYVYKCNIILVITVQMTKFVFHTYTLVTRFFLFISIYIFFIAGNWGQCRTAWKTTRPPKLLLKHGKPKLLLKQSFR